MKELVKKEKEKEKEFTLDFCPNCLSYQEWSLIEQRCYFCGYKIEKSESKGFSED